MACLWHLTVQSRYNRAKFTNLLQFFWFVIVYMFRITNSHFLKFVACLYGPNVAKYNLVQTVFFYFTFCHPFTLGDNVPSSAEFSLLAISKPLPFFQKPYLSIYRISHFGFSHIFQLLIFTCSWFCCMCGSGVHRRNIKIQSLSGTEHNIRSSDPGSLL